MESMDREDTHVSKIIERKECILHDPSRQNQIGELEFHVLKCRKLSRAAWVIVESWIKNYHVTEIDIRDLDALSDVLDELAHHTSASEFNFYTSDSFNDPTVCTEAKRTAVGEFMERFDAERKNA